MISFEAVFECCSRQICFVIDIVATAQYFYASRWVVVLKSINICLIAAGPLVAEDELLSRKFV